MMENENLEELTKEGLFFHVGGIPSGDGRDNFLMKGRQGPERTPGHFRVCWGKAVSQAPRSIYTSFEFADLRGKREVLRRHTSRSGRSLAATGPWTYALFGNTAART